MFDKKSIDGDIVAIDNQAVGAQVLVPAHAGPMIGAPDPGVIDDGVVAVDFQICRWCANGCATVAEKDIVREMGFWRPGVASLRANLDQHRRFDWAGIEKETGNDDAVRVSGGKSSRTVDRAESGEA